MKIGILTFHWGTNYGGVLQSFALQTFLQKHGFDSQIVNFAPPTFRDSIFRCFRTKSPKVLFSNLKNFIKEKNIEKFRKVNLNLTERYYSIKELDTLSKDFDVLITGSDQVWNPYGIKNYDLVYFLPFKGECKKISYAPSFGCVEYPKDVLKKIIPLIKDFDAISVREKSGLSILGDFGINEVKLMPDPTLLLDKIDYLNLIKNTKKRKSNYAFFYTLQPNQKLIIKIYKSIDSKMKTISTLNTESSTMGIESWIGTIYYSDFVITNSFHGVIFSLLLNKNFIVIPIEGTLTGMNDRIYTLLDMFDLKERLVDVFDEKTMYDKIKNPIDWDRIKKAHHKIRQEASSFLLDNITN